MLKSILILVVLMFTMILLQTGAPAIRSDEAVGCRAVVASRRDSRNICSFPHAWFVKSYDFLFVFAKAIVSMVGSVWCDTTAETNIGSQVKDPDATRAFRGPNLAGHIRDVMIGCLARPKAPLVARAQNPTQTDNLENAPR